MVFGLLEKPTCVKSLVGARKPTFFFLIFRPWKIVDFVVWEESKQTLEHLHWPGFDSGSEEKINSLVAEGGLLFSTWK